MQRDNPDLVDLWEEWKANHPGVPIVWKGRELDRLNAIIKNTWYFDYVVSKEGHTLRSFIDHFQSNLPQIIMVKHGYMGYDDDMHSFGSDESYWIDNMHTQSRLLTKDTVGTHVSIPVETTLKVQIMDVKNNKVGKPITVKEMVDTYKKVPDDDESPFFIMFEENESVSYSMGTDMGDCKSLGVMRVIDEYEQLYLVGYTVYCGLLHPDIRSIPVYMPITVCTCNGIKGESNKSFKGVFEHLKCQSKRVDHDNIMVNTEIMLLSENPVDNDYEYIVPMRGSRVSYAAANCLLQASTPMVPSSAYGMARAIASHRPIQPKVKKTFRPLPPVPGESSPSTGDQSASRNQPRGRGAPVPDELLGACASVERPVKGIALEQAKKGPKQDPQYINTRPHAAIKPSVTTHQVHGAEHVDMAKRPLPKVPGKKSKSGGSTVSTYQRFQDVPADTSDLSVHQLADCLSLFNLQDHAKDFIANDIDGELLKTLDREVLCGDLRLSNLNAIKLQKFAAGWRPKE